MRALASKSVLVGMVAAPLILGFVGATPALADGTINSPRSGTYSGSWVDIEASATSAQETDLTLTDPVGSSRPIVVARSPSPALRSLLSFHLDTACWARSTACSSGVPAPNGTWKIAVTASMGSKGAQQLFVLAVPPASPAGFSARGSGSRQVTFTWSRGAEPDLTSYTLYDGAGTVVRAGMSVAAACHGTACSYVLKYPADAPGRHDFALGAYRKTDPADAGTLPSRDRAKASATLGTTLAARSTLARGPVQPAAGRPTGPSAPRSSPSGPAVPPGDSGAGRALGQALAAFAPNLALAQLPALPTNPGPTLAEAPLPLGTFRPGLPYAPMVAQEPVRLAGPVRSAGRSTSAALDTGQLLRSLAGALVLLLAGAHLRRFVLTKPDP